MGFNEWFTIINTIIGVIGIVVGIIGGKSLHTATKIKNSIKVENTHNSTIQQAQTITVNNGMDTYAVIKISRETTQGELEMIVNRINQAETKLSSVEQKVDNLPPIPEIIVSESEPTSYIGDGKIWGVYK